jgi:hypothetical protein
VGGGLGGAGLGNDRSGVGGETGREHCPDYCRLCGTAFEGGSAGGAHRANPPPIRADRLAPSGSTPVTECGNDDGVCALPRLTAPRARIAVLVRLLSRRCLPPATWLQQIVYAIRRKRGALLSAPSAHQRAEPKSNCPYVQGPQKPAWLRAFLDIQALAKVIESRESERALPPGASTSRQPEAKTAPLSGRACRAGHVALYCRPPEVGFACNDAGSRTRRVAVVTTVAMRHGVSAWRPRADDDPLHAGVPACGDASGSQIPTASVHRDGGQGAPSIEDTGGSHLMSPLSPRDTRSTHGDPEVAGSSPVAPVAASLSRNRSLPLLSGETSELSHMRNGMPSALERPLDYLVGGV